MEAWAKTLTLLGRTWRLGRHDAKEAVYTALASLMQLLVKRHSGSVSVALFGNFGAVLAHGVGADVGIALSSLETETRAALEGVLPGPLDTKPGPFAPGQDATLVFTDLVLALMRARSEGGGFADKDAVAIALVRLAVCNQEDRFPNVPAVARFVCELEEAER